MEAIGGKAARKEHSSMNLTKRELQIIRYALSYFSANFDDEVDFVDFEWGNLEQELKQLHDKVASLLEKKRGEAHAG